MLVLAGISFATGTAFLMAGAWPVMGFFGLDVLLVWLAFRANYRDAQEEERLSITRSVVRYIHRSPEGRETVKSLQPVYARAELHALPGKPGRPRPGYIAISEGVRQIRMGRFLGEEERMKLVRRINACLESLRN